MSLLLRYDPEKGKLVQISNSAKNDDDKTTGTISQTSGSKYVTFQKCLDNGLVKHQARLYLYRIDKGSNNKFLKKVYLTELKLKDSKLIVFKSNQCYCFILDNDSANHKDETMAFGSVIITEMKEIFESSSSKNLEIDFNEACSVTLEFKDSEKSHSQQKTTSENQNNIIEARKAFRKNVTIFKRNHLLKKPKKAKQAYCAHCKKKKHEKLEPIYKCKTCELSIHVNCIEFILGECKGVIGESGSGELTFKRPTTDNIKNSATLNVPHSFEVSKKTGIFCSHCGEKIRILTSHSKCTYCTLHFHDKCIPNVPNLCGVSADIIQKIMQIGQKTKPVEEHTEAFDTKDFFATVGKGLCEPEPNYNMYIDKFSPISKIGEGSFGKVFSALHKPSGIVMALKALSMDIEIDDDFDAMVWEMLVMRVASGCQFLVQLYGAFIVNGFVYFAMELCPGGNIFEYIQRNRMPTMTIKEVFAQLVLATDFLHENFIINRDLKSDNVLITHKGTVKICDFGLSKSLRNQSSPVCYTFCGTLPYMSPELIRVYYSTPGKRESESPTDKGVYGMAVDYWALAILFYELHFGGKMPFCEDTEKSIVNAIASKEEFKLDLEDANATNMIQQLLKKRFKDRITPEKDTTHIKKNTNILKEHKYFSTINWDSLQAEDYRGPFSVLDYMDPEKPEQYMKKANKTKFSVSLAENTPDQIEQFKVFNYCKKEINQPAVHD